MRNQIVGLGLSIGMGFGLGSAPSNSGGKKIIEDSGVISPALSGGFLTLGKPGGGFDSSGSHSGSGTGSGGSGSHSGSGGGSGGSGRGRIPSHPVGCCLEALLSFFLQCDERGAEMTSTGLSSPTSPTHSASHSQSHSQSHSTTHSQSQSTTNSPTTSSHSPFSPTQETGSVWTNFVTTAMINVIMSASSVLTGGLAVDCHLMDFNKSITLRGSSADRLIILLEGYFSGERS